MDRETRHELDRLRKALAAAVDDVSLAANEGAEMRAWIRIRTLGFELNEVLSALTAAPKSA